MRLENLPAGVTDWSGLPVTETFGDSGTAGERARQFGDVRLRMIEFSAGYVADGWCAKGHIVLVVAGEIIIEHQGGDTQAIGAGMSYHVSDEVQPHRVVSEAGATIFVVD